MESTTDFVAHSLINTYKLNKGERVLLVFFPGLDFTVSLLSCFKAGLIAVPVFPPDPSRLNKDLDHFINIQSSCGATVVLTNSQYNYANKLSSLKNFFSTKTVEWPNMNWIIVDGLIKRGKSNSAKKVEYSLPLLRNDDVAFLQYTSGSTSYPKGVMVTYNNLNHNHNLMFQQFNISASVDENSISLSC